MKIIRADEVPHVTKPEGTKVHYYLFKDYEVHYNEQAPHTVQTWHHHEKIAETLYIISGDLKAEWREGEEVKARVVSAGDVIETGRVAHTFSNDSDEIVQFLVIKRMPSDQDFSELFKQDKILD